MQHEPRADAAPLPVAPPLPTVAPPSAAQATPPAAQDAPPAAQATPPAERTAPPDRYPPHHQHRRGGSTGTTADSSYASDEEREEDELAAGGGGSDEEPPPAVGGAARLREELRRRDEELEVLRRDRRNADEELEELTASLFQEAHGMVRAANERREAAERALQEARMRLDVTAAEVAALKTLVLTSTPSAPNLHLHAQVGPASAAGDQHGATIFARKHRRSPSHCNLKYGRENSSPPESPSKETYQFLGAVAVDSKEGLEVDPVLHKEFMEWRTSPTLSKSDAFIKRLYSEDVDLCLSFPNKELSENVKKAVEGGTILIEAVNDKTKAMFPKTCALSEMPRLCFYRMNIGDNENWFSISQICRNRIIAVCDCLNYLKYIERGLVKSSAHDVYWEIIRLRKNICLARLGLSLNT